MYPGKDFREQSDEIWEYADGFSIPESIPDPVFRKVPLYHPALRYRTLSEAQEACLGAFSEICTGITRVGQERVQKLTKRKLRYETGRTRKILNPCVPTAY